MNHFALGGILVLALCSSCSVYQYNTLTSDINSTAREPFAFENDTLLVRYSFPNGQANIEIVNKLATPMYVDWSRSALIINGKAESYQTNESKVDLTTSEYRFLSNNNQSYTTGVITNTSTLSFIPPNSGLKTSPFNLRNKFQPLEIIDKTGKPQEYSYEESPMKFRSYLMLSFDQDFSRPITFDHSFWLSEMRQSSVPMSVSNTYSHSTLTKGGSTAVGILFIALVVPVLALYGVTQ